MTQKRLIIHGDDLGMARSINRATFQALESGAVTSASAMLPAPFFDEVAEYTKSHPGSDIGIHLTLTSEGTRLPMRPVLDSGQVRSLVDRNGSFHGDLDTFLDRADPIEVQNEIQAQIETATRKGLAPTHLDSHMTALESREDLRSLLISIAKDMGLPSRAELQDRVFSAPAGSSGGDQGHYYLAILAGLKSGVSELVVHLGFDDEELRALTQGTSDWNAAWRQTDFAFVTSAFFRSAVERLGVELVGWK